MSSHSTEYVAKEVLAYIKKWIPDQRVGVLAGNSVHVDKAFLAEEMPEVVDHLHYRSVLSAERITADQKLMSVWYTRIVGL